MTTTEKMTDDQLAAQATLAAEQHQAAQTEQGRRAADRRAADHQAQRVQAQHVLDTWKAIDERFDSEGLAAEKQGLAAVQARDISAALTAFMAYRASRFARNVVRDAAIGAHNILGSESHGIINITIYGGPFSEWLSELAEQTARTEGYDAGAAAIGLEE